MNRKHNTIITLTAAVALSLVTAASHAALITSDGTTGPDTSSASAAGNFLRATFPDASGSGVQAFKLVLPSSNTPASATAGDVLTLSYDVRTFSENNLSNPIKQEVIGGANSQTDFNVHKVPIPDEGDGFARVESKFKVEIDTNGSIYLFSEIGINIERSLVGFENRGIVLDFDNFELRDGSGSLVGSTVDFESDNVGDNQRPDGNIDSINVNGLSGGEASTYGITAEIAADTTVIPEPASLALVGLGGLIFAGSRRWRFARHL